MQAAARPEISKDRLLDTAARLFAQQGFHSTSVRELAAAQKIKAGSLYYHIASKDQLLIEVCEVGMTRIEENVAAAFADASDVSGAIERLITLHVETAADFGDYLWCFEREFPRLPVESQNELGARLAAFHDTLDKAFDRGKESGELDGTVETRIARLNLIGILLQLSRLARDGRSNVLSRTANGLGSLFMAGLRSR